MTAAATEQSEARASFLRLFANPYESMAWSSDTVFTGLSDAVRAVRNLV
jgi:hypothetical protein